MNRTLVKIGIVVAGLVVALAGGAALAGRSFGPHAMQRRMSAFIDGALDAAKADPAQRKTIEAARDRAFAAFKDTHQGRRELMTEALSLFEADALDGARVAAIKDARLAEMQKSGDAVVAALTEAHDALRPEQRQAVVAYLRDHQPGGGKGAGHGAGMRGEMMKRFASGRIDDMLDEIDATSAQRAVVGAARDHVFAAFEENMKSADSDLREQALALFAADRIDSEQVKALRAAHQAHVARVADAMVQALHDVHDALTPAQRHQVTAEIRARAGRFHHGLGPHAG